MQDQNIKTKVQYWSHPSLDEAKERLSQDDLRELFNDIQESEFFESESGEIDPEDKLEKAIDEGNQELYEELFADIRDFARERITPNYQPDWAWSLLSFQPEEIDGEVLEVPSGGEHKGIMLTESGKRIGLYPKEEEEREIPTPVQHVERWALNFDNKRSLGYELPSGSYHRIDIDDPTSDEENPDPITMLSMDFNAEMVIGDNLEEYLTTFVSQEKADEIIDYFDERRGQHTTINLDEKDIDDLKDRKDLLYEALKYHDLSEVYEEIESEEKDIDELRDEDLIEEILSQEEVIGFGEGDRPEENENSLYPLNIGHASGEIVSTGILDYTQNKGNFAYILPENWHVGKVEPDRIYEETDIVIVDIGEYTEMMNDNMIEEDPFLSEDQKDEFRDDEDDYDFEPRTKGMNSSSHSIF